MPAALAGSRIERHDRRAIQAGARAIDAVEVIGRRTERNVHDAEPRVDRHLTPVVNAPDVLVGLLRPAIVAEFAGTRDGVERPYGLAGEHVVSADVAGRRHVVLTRCTADNHKVLEDLAR